MKNTENIVLSPEETNKNMEEQKRKIREKYKSCTSDFSDNTHSGCEIDIYNIDEDKRIAVYLISGVKSPNATCVDIRKYWYEEWIRNNPHLTLVDFYMDEGITNNTSKNRDEFLRMIADCRAGKIDLIIAKSCSRFAGNLNDCISYTKELAAMKPPVGVFFETERIYTLDDKSKMTLSFIAALAQEESKNKSPIMITPILNRFSTPEE